MSKKEETRQQAPEEPTDTGAEEPTNKLAVAAGSNLDKILNYKTNAGKVQEKRKSVLKSVTDIADVTEKIDHPYMTRRGITLLAQGITKWDKNRMRVGFNKARGKAITQKDILKGNLEMLNDDLDGMVSQMEEAERDLDNLYEKLELIIEERAELGSIIKERQTTIQKLNSEIENYRVKIEKAEKAHQSDKVLEYSKVRMEKEKESDKLQRLQAQDNTKAMLKHREANEMEIAQKEIRALLPHIEQHITSFRFQIDQYSSYIESNTASMELTNKMAVATKHFDKTREILNQMQRERSKFSDNIDAIAAYMRDTPLVDDQTNAKKISSIGKMERSFKESYKAVEAYDAEKIDNMHPMEAYKILGLEMDASKDDVKSATKKLALEYHPDRAIRNGISKEDAEHHMNVIKAAEMVIYANIKLAEEPYHIRFGKPSKKALKAQNKNPLSGYYTRKK